MGSPFEYIVIGAGSAGCAVAAGLAARDMGRILVIEAGGNDRSPLVKVPMGLVRLMGHKTKDWRYVSSPQSSLNRRAIKMPRGKLLGGSGSINSMVWLRGTRADFADWNLPNWSEAEVMTAFDQVEAHTTPERLAHPHPLSDAISRHFAQNDPTAAPTPERHSGGVTYHNLVHGKRRSAADAFLRPALATGRVEIMTKAQIDRIVINDGVARTVILVDGTEITANTGIILSAGSIGSTEILLRSGVGAADDLHRLGINCVIDAPEVGANLHDHPTVPIHFAGPNSGYGLSLRQMATWIRAPFDYAFDRAGPWASPTVEAVAFFGRDPAARPEFQMHFLPFMIGWQGKKITWGQGYLADVCLCRPQSRGRLRITSKHPMARPEIDLGLLTDDRDIADMVVGFRMLRQMMQDIDFGPHRAPEAWPGSRVETDDDIIAYLRDRVATAYHPVGTLRMGADAASVVDATLKVRGTQNLWVADASIMPSITSANTNAPSMMIGHRAAQFISEAA